MKKNLILLFFSTLISLVLFCFLLYIYTFINLNKTTSYKFNSIELLEFHKKYSSVMHHLRANEQILRKNSKRTEYLFSIINEFKPETDNILFQGDSWAEQLSFPREKVNKIPNTEDSVKKIFKDKNTGFINAGIQSFSPTVMKLQLKILEDEFKVTPNIIIAYIDQSDLGDENCRYKKNKIFKNNKLVAVKTKSHSGRLFDYSQIYGESEILLKDHSKSKKALNLLIFRIKYNFIKIKNKNIEKFSKILKSGLKERKIEKCYWNTIQEYLNQSTNDEINYFKDSVDQYINYIERKKNIKRLFIVTFPHKRHIAKLLKDIEKPYKHNVSELVSDLLKNKKKTYHINFTKLIFEHNFPIAKDSYIKDDPASHLGYEYYEKFFMNKIINYIFDNLNNQI